MRAISMLSIRFLLAIFFISFSIVIGGEQPEPSQAPQLTSVQTEPEPGRGFVPPPMDLSHIDGSHMDIQAAPMTFPIRFDLREAGQVTGVRNQGACGSCYAFAALANIESKMLVDAAGTFDFSENNAKECNYYATSCDGGNYYKMASFFSKYGTVLESCDPYVASDVSCNSSCTYQKTLLGWEIISGGAVASTDNIKTALQNYGAVYTSLDAGSAGDPTWSSEFNSYDGSYTMYHTGSSSTNHAVLIVGWDDTLSHAGGSGAWIVKNSWGTSWGGTCGYGAEGGYFTIAYGSALIGSYVSYMSDWQDYDSNGDLYFYDEGGWTNSWGYGSSTVCYALSKFTPSENTYLTHVEIWNNDVTLDIDVEIYDNFDGTTPSTLLGSEYNSAFSSPGYHSIELTTPILLSSGDPIYIKVKVENNSELYPIIGDDQGSIETATTYISSTGGNGSWYDLGVNQSSDVAIRMRTSTVVGIDDEQASLPTNTLILRNYPNPFNQSTTIEYGIPAGSHVKLVVYDILGRQVETLINDYIEAGYHSIDWNSDGNPTGYYFYKLTAGSDEKVGRMLLLK